MIPYFTTAEYNDGDTLLTVSNSSTNGFSLTASALCTVGSPCHVSASRSVQITNSSMGIGFSLNSSQLTTDFTSIADGPTKLTEQSMNNAYAPVGGIAVTIEMISGDVLRPHDDSPPTISKSTIIVNVWR
jgi:hypothetical protein